MTDKQIHSRPILFIGMQRTATSSLYQIVSECFPGRTSKVKEHFVLHFYTTNIAENYFDKFRCEPKSIVDFCPSFYGSWLAFGNLKFLKKHYNFDPILVLINRDHNAYINSAVTYFNNRKVLSDNSYEYHIDTCMAQCGDAKFLRALQNDFTVREFVFEELVNDESYYQEMMYELFGISSPPPMVSSNDSRKVLNNGNAAYFSLRLYRKIRGILPRQLVKYVAKSALAKKLLFKEPAMGHESKYQKEIIQFLQDQIR